MEQRPAWVERFEKPPNTEIKHIQNGWYLYRCSSEYDSSKGRAQKKSGEYLGRITEKGFVAKRIKRPADCHADDVVEMGAVQFCYGRTQRMRSSLQIMFPDLWQLIYVLALIRTLYEGTLSRIALHYEDSILSYMYPGLSLSPASISRLLQDLGRRHKAIREYMQREMPGRSDFLILDGHRILSASKKMGRARRGYDSQQRHKTQINVLYMFAVSSGIGTPSFYEPYSGDTNDVSAISRMIRHAKVEKSQCIVVGDKGCASKDIFKSLSEDDLYYCMPLKRNNSITNGNVPFIGQYEDVFCFQGRPIHALRFDRGDFAVHLYLDESLHSQELMTLIERTEKENAARAKKLENKMAEAEKAGSQLSEKELAKYAAIRIQDAVRARPNMGILVLQTNKMDLTNEQVYTIYKQREAIEDFFKTYVNTLRYDTSYMQSDVTEDAWLFLNHLSACICVDILELLSSLELSKSYSFHDFIEEMMTIRAERIDGEWDLVPVRKNARELCKKVAMEPGAFTDLGL